MNKRYTRSIVVMSLFLSAVSLNGQNNSYPSDWHLVKNDSVCGANVVASNEFLKNKGAEKTNIVVGILDSGVDSTHVDLNNSLWINSKELPGNGIDDDKNGYIDDTHGWNFLGSADGSFNLSKTGTEPFREYKRLRPKYKYATREELSKSQQLEFDYYKRMEREAKLNTYIAFNEYLRKMANAYKVSDSLMTKFYTTKDSVTVADFFKLEVDDTTGLMSSLNIVAASVFVYGEQALWKEAYDHNVGKYEESSKRVESLDNANDDPRLKVGDDIYNFKDRFYGNPMFNIVDDGHGTMVAGVVAAAGNNDSGVRGVFPEAKIMSVRMAPDGDEYDKDVASAIRYAVDNGAKVINMSFGKTVSPNYKEVDKAVKYAAKKDVLLISAAGNTGVNIDSVMTYPRLGDGKTKYSNMICVGASTSSGAKAKFSCYGVNSVDVFAPGSNIVSTTLDNKYAKADGTSIAAPVVSGIAAMIRSYYPDLSAAQVKKCIVGSVYKTKESLPCISGGIVDAYQAVKMADQMSEFGK